MGVVTGFSSICVNGLKVEVDTTTNLQRGGQPIAPNDLSVGQVVVVHASSDNGRLSAVSAIVKDAVVGPVTAVDAARGLVWVMGQQAVALAPDALTGLVVGNWVRLGRHRMADGEVRASSVQRITAVDAEVTGSLRMDGQGGWRVGDIGLRAPEGLELSPALADAEVRVVGQWDGQRMVVRRITGEPSQNVLRGSERVFLEGYVQRLDEASLGVGYAEVRLDAQTRWTGLSRGSAKPDEIEAGIDAALRRHGYPATIVSTPFAPLPDKTFGAAGDAALSPDEFRQPVQDNLTHQFRVARKASLIDGTQLVLVSPDVPAGSDPSGTRFALANFIKTTLHAFTATLAVENERLVHDVPVNQINLTRRARSEEPRNEAEHQEEVKRFARAVLLAGAPLPDAEDSRYRARIYRGMAITV